VVPAKQSSRPEVWSQAKVERDRVRPWSLVSLVDWRRREWLGDVLDVSGWGLGFGFGPGLALGFWCCLLGRRLGNHLYTGDLGLGLWGLRLRGLRLRGLLLRDLGSLSCLLLEVIAALSLALLLSPFLWRQFATARWLCLAWELAFFGTRTVRLVALGDRLQR